MTQYRIHYKSPHRESDFKLDVADNESLSDKMKDYFERNPNSIPTGVLNLSTGEWVDTSVWIFI